MTLARSHENRTPPPRTPGRFTSLMPPKTPAAPLTERLRPHDGCCDQFLERDGPAGSTAWGPRRAQAGSRHDDPPGPDPGGGSVRNGYPWTDPRGHRGLRSRQDHTAAGDLGPVGHRLRLRLPPDGGPGPGIPGAAAHALVLGSPQHLPGGRRPDAGPDGRPVAGAGGARLGRSPPTGPSLGRHASAGVHRPGAVDRAESAPGR